MPKNKASVTYAGLILIIVVWIAALGLLLARPAGSSETALPTLVTMPEQAFIVSPTPVPVSLVSAPAASVEKAAQAATQTTEDLPEVLRDPVPNQFVIHFDLSADTEARAAYIASIGGNVEQEIAALNAVVVIVPESIAQSALPASPIIAASEPDYYVSALDANDPFYNDQWALPVVNAPAAWAVLPPDAPAVTVAVIDSGACLTHPDLAGRFISGYDYVENDTTPQDTYGHGCKVTGIIAANRDNWVGMAGVVPNVNIIPLRVLDGEGIGKYSDVAAAIIDATDDGADIINLSLGGYFTSSVMQNAITYAIDHDVLVIAAAGNTGNETVLYPALYPSVVAVGSINEAGNISSFSSSGDEIDLWAPGEAVLTTTTAGGYQDVNGTSFASPYVSGVAALEMMLGNSLTIDGGTAYVRVTTPIVEPTPEVTPEITPEPVVVDPPGRGVVDEEPPILTDQWAVILQTGTNPDTLAAQLGFENLGPVGDLKDTYIFRFPNSDSDTQVQQASGALLDAAPEVIYYQQQVILKPDRRVPTDPQYPNQWHLNNTGQGGGTPGVDANVVGAWNAGYDGTGVQIAIVDDGVEHTHPDLAPNYFAAGSRDFDSNDNDPAPAAADENHGTSVAGVAAGADDGASCGVGAAYNAQFAGIRLNIILDVNTAGAENYQYQTNDIFSNSWGPPDNGATMWLPSQLPLSLAALQNGVLNGRGGLGTIFVWAGGNGQDARDNVNRDLFANSRYAIAVGAVDDDGIQAWYSEPGAPLLIVAPSNGGSSGITTTDRAGTNGYNTSAGTAGNCTNTFGGTSSATPLVSGVIALMLDANPNLTWRDVKHILIETALKNDSTNLGDASDWTTNAAGYDINHAYGFGLIDAEAAVSEATTWTNVSEELSHTAPLRTVNLAIPDNSPANYVPGTAVTDVINVTRNLRLETVEVVFTATHSFRGDINVTLTSPSGTQSKMLVTSDDSGDNYSSWVMTSNRYWGEFAAGNWTISVSDGYSTLAGVFVSWQLRIYGTDGPQSGPTLSVTRTDDVNDGSCTELDCSLREAIIAANTQSGANTINLPTGTYTLSLTGTGENAAATGDLDITGSLTINGVGSAATFIDGDEIDRIFEVRPGGHTVSIYGLTLQNGSVNQGGALYNSQGLVTLNVVTLYDNTATSHGGALYNASGTLTVSNSIFDDNQTTLPSPNGLGGAIYLNSGTLNITNSSFTNNTATVGGALHINATTTITSSMFESNSAQINGGAIYTIAGITQSNNTFSNNQASLGGAFYTIILQTVNQTLFVGNTATSDGGAYYNSSFATSTFNNVTFSDNTAADQGGAIYATNSTTTHLKHTTLADNSATNGKDVYSVSSGPVTFAFSILGSTGGDNCAGTGNLVSLDYNVGRDSTCSLNDPNDLEDTNPLLDVLSDYGGLTQTYNLMAFSPAIDLIPAGDCTFITDQRGITRPFNEFCDAGAFETTQVLQGAPSTLTATAQSQIRIDLGWQDNWSEETAMRIEHSTDGISGWTQIANLPANTTTHIVNDLDCNTTYYFRAYAFDSVNNRYSNYTNITSATTNACPPNDDLANAQTIPSLTYTDSQTMPGARPEGTDPTPSCVPLGRRTVWYTYTPASDEYVWIDTIGSDFNTVLSVWWDNGGTLEEIACNDESGLGSVSFLAASLTGGQQVFIMVSSHGNVGGNHAFKMQAGVISPTAIPTNTPIPSATPEPYTAHIGLFADGIWMMSNTNSGGLPDMTFGFGQGEKSGYWQPLVGDWDGDLNQVDTNGLYHEGIVLLRDTNGSGFADNRFLFGPQESGWQAISGDWDGNSADSVGLYKNGRFMLRNNNTDGPADTAFLFGPQEAGWTAVSGDWNGDGIDTIGVYKDGVWHLRNSNSAGPIDRTIQFGSSSAKPVIGDWNKDGVDTIGVYQKGTWYLRNTSASGAPDLQIKFGNTLRNWQPIAGRWDGSLPLGMLLGDTGPVIPTATMTATTEPIITETPTFTQEAVTQPTETTVFTAEPSITMTETPTIVPTATETPWPTATDIPTLTALPGEIPSETATALLIETPTATPGE